MHGTFPSRGTAGRSFQLDTASIGVALGFAAMPLIIATIAAILRFGSAVTASDILDILVAATLAAPL
jgi:hypothetical protein